MLVWQWEEGTQCRVLVSSRAPSDPDPTLNGCSGGTIGWLPSSPPPPAPTHRPQQLLPEVIKAQHGGRTPAIQPIIALGVPARGRGRQGRAWVRAPDGGQACVHGLMLSVILRACSCMRGCRKRSARGPDMWACKRPGTRTCRTPSPHPRPPGCAPPRFQPSTTLLGRPPRPPAQQQPRSSGTHAAALCSPHAPPPALPLQPQCCCCWCCMLAAGHGPMCARTRACACCGCCCQCAPARQPGTGGGARQQARAGRLGGGGGSRASCVINSSGTPTLRD